MDGRPLVGAVPSCLAAPVVCRTLPIVGREAVEGASTVRASSCPSFASGVEGTNQHDVYRTRKKHSKRSSVGCHYLSPPSCSRGCVQNGVTRRGFGIGRCASPRRPLRRPARHFACRSPANDADSISTNDSEQLLSC
jgi:hypothetical protein